jgi:hypothetical protein
VGEGEDLCGAPEDLGRNVQPQGPGVVDGDVAQRGAGPEGQLLPGDQVGVVLHFGDHNLVARADCEFVQPGVAAAVRCPQRSIGQRVADQVQAFGGVGSPYRFRVIGTDEVRQGLAGVLENLGCFDGEVVGSAVHGSVALFIEFLLGFDDAERVLRGGARIQVHQGLAVHQLAQHGEVVSNPEHFSVVHGRHCAFKRGWRCYEGQS